MGILEDTLTYILLNQVRHYKAEFFNSRLGFCQNLILLLEVNRASAVLVNFFWGARYVKILSLVRFKPWSKIIILVQRFPQVELTVDLKLFLFHTESKNVKELEKLKQQQRQDCLKGTITGSVQATDRLMKELKDIFRSESYKQGSV